jgi:hypothetical protein
MLFIIGALAAAAIALALIIAASIFAADVSSNRLFPEQTRSMMVGQSIRRDEGADDACVN